jgi:hypothetical protein
MKKAIMLIMFLTISIIGFTRIRAQDNVSIENSRIPGYKGIIDLGYASGIGKSGMNNLKLNLINSFRSGPCFSVGLGIGYRYYFQKEYDQYSARSDLKWYSVVPVFLDFRTTFRDKKVSPYLAFGAGYSFGGRPMAIFEIAKVGYMLNGAVGGRLKLSGKSEISAGIVYEIQEMDAFFYRNNHADIGNYFNGTNVSLGSIAICIGYSF